MDGNHIPDAESMVERVARRLQRVHYERGRALWPGWPDDKFEREMWRVSARAAIEAMGAVVNGQAPSTNEMTHAFDVAYRQASARHGHLESWNAGWVAAIDAALTDKP